MILRWTVALSNADVSSCRGALYRCTVLIDKGGPGSSLSVLIVKGVRESTLSVGKSRALHIA